MNRRQRCGVPVVLLLAACVTPMWAAQQPKPAPAHVCRTGDQPVAMIGDKTITDAQLEELAKDRLARLRSEEYTIKRQVLDEHVTQVLLEREATARGITREQLEQREVDGKVLPVTAARQLSLNATPTFFINGRLLSGAQSSQAFAAVIDQELTRVVASK